MHPLNADSSITVTPSGIIIDCRLMQPSNADFSIVVTLSGISIDCRLVHPLNADSSITATLLGITIDCRLVQSLNDSLPITVTLLGITIDCRLVQPLNAKVPICVAPSSRIIPFPSITLYVTLYPITTVLKIRNVLNSMSKLSTFLCNCKSFVAEEKESSSTLFMIFIRHQWRR